MIDKGASRGDVTPAGRTRLRRQWDRPIVRRMQGWITGRRDTMEHRVDPCTSATSGPGRPGSSVTFVTASSPLWVIGWG